MRTKAPRTARSNKQNMHYSLYSGTVPVYEVDEDGLPLYIEVDGEQVRVEAGTQAARYTTPVPFVANISSELNEMHMKAWGVDQSSIYSEIVCQKGYLPLDVGAIIWRTSPITYDEDDNAFIKTDDGKYIVVGGIEVEDGQTYLVGNSGERIPHQASSDYTVVGIRTEGLWEDWYLLQKNSSDSPKSGGGSGA